MDSLAVTYYHSVMLFVYKLTISSSSCISTDLVDNARARVPEAQPVLGASRPQEAVHLLVGLLRGGQVLLSSNLQHGYDLVFMLTTRVFLF